MPVVLGGLAAADLLTLLAWAICLGLAISWRHTIGAAFIWLADELDKAAIDLPWPVGTVHIFGPLSSALRTVEKNVAHWLGAAALATEHATLFLWNHTVSIVEETARWIEHAALTELHAWTALFTVSLPRYFHDFTRRVHDLIHASEAETRKAETAIRRETAHEIARVESKTEHLVNRIEARLSTVVLPRIRTVEHDLGALKDKVDRLAKSLSRDALVALIAATLWKELTGGLKCNNITKTAKGLCGLGTDLLDALLLGTLAVIGSVSLVGMANEAVNLADTFVPTVLGFFSEIANVPRHTAAEQGFE